jgi:hypothetical protein
MPAPDNQQPADFLPWMIDNLHGSKKGVDSLDKNPHATEWIQPALSGNFAAPPAPMSPVQYRLHTKTNSLEFRGHLDATLATTNTKAFTLIRPFWRAYDITFITDAFTGVTVLPARVYIYSSNGEVWVRW